MNMQREKGAGRVAGKSPSGYKILTLICMNVTTVSPKVVKHFFVNQAVYRSLLFGYQPDIVLKMSTRNLAER